MPDVDGRSSLHEDALASIGRELTVQFQATPLGAKELSEYRGHIFSAGWRLEVSYEDGVRRMDLLLPFTIPFDVPKVAVVDRPDEPLTWPHIEANGILCLDDTRTTVNFRNPVGVALDILSDATSLVQANIAGANQQDFLDEFHSYWHRSSEGRGQQFLSLIEPAPPSRSIHAWPGQRFVLLAESATHALHWLDNRFGKADRADALTPALLVWLDRPLIPAEYPNRASDVMRFISELAPASEGVLRGLTHGAPNRIDILLGAPSKNGPCLAGITLKRPATIKRAAAGKPPQMNGFRPGHAPAGLVESEYLDRPTLIEKSDVSRVDAAWIHGRGHDSRHTILIRSEVAVVGCGSIGGHVSALLAQAGVGKLTLVDAENLSWANVGRHILSAKRVDCAKASSLAAQLRENYPHLTIKAHDKAWEQLDTSILQQSSLIVNTTGSWKANAAMNVWQRTTATPPVLYGWTEAYACAGHAVAIGSRGPCLECGFGPTGRSLMPVTSWQSGATELQEPACGVWFQPFGPVELMSTVQLISGAALDLLTGKREPPTHFVYIGQRSRVADCGGTLMQEWEEVPGWRAEGGCYLVRDWPIRQDCRGQH